METKLQENDPKLQSWIAGAQEKINENFTKNFPRLTPGKLSIQCGRRYIKVFNDQSGQKSLFVFIDQNGDVLKPATYSAPAKHARGNIFDESNGLKFVGPYGPAYLRYRHELHRPSASR